jgi:hypothetical protein
MAIKEIEAPLEVLNKIEATGLPCRWKGAQGVLVVTLDSESTEQLLKFGRALSGAARIKYHCVRTLDES